MKIRKKPYGQSNIVGKNIEALRKAAHIEQDDFISRIQTMGCNINPTSYSKLEGQLRKATDIEIYTIAKVLNITVDELFKTPPKKE